MEFFLLYLFVMIENIGSMFWLGWPLMWVSLGVMVVTAFFCMLQTESYGEDRTFSEILEEPVQAKIIKLAKRLAIIGGCLIIVHKLMPDQKQLAIIVGSGMAYNVITSGPVKEIGNKAFQLLERKVNEALKDEQAPPKVEAPKPEPKPEPTQEKAPVAGQAT